jgi:phage terminase Nu1 subunit (DNA packaging protein)
MNLPRKVSTSGLATLLSVDERTVGKLVAKKILVREARGTFDVVDSIAAFIAHREAVVAAEHGVGAYGKARAQLYLERARAARMKREELEGALLPAGDVLAFNVGIVSVARNRMLAIPSKLAAQLVGIRTAGAAEALVRAEIYEALEGLSKLNDVAGKK